MLHRFKSRFSETLYPEKHRAEAIGTAGDKHARFCPDEITATRKGEHILLDIAPRPTAEPVRHVGAAGDELLSFLKSLAEFSGRVGRRLQKVFVNRSSEHGDLDLGIHCTIPFDPVRMDSSAA